MSLRSPLARVLGLGSAKAGTDHWWAQRLTAIAMVPLGLWFAFALPGMPHGNFQLMQAWVAETRHAIPLLLLVVTLVYHSSLGVQVVLEDYVHGGAGVAARVLSKFVHVALAVAGIYAVVVVSVGVGS